MERRRPGREGFSLVEVMLALAILMVGTAGVMQLLLLSYRNFTWAAANYAATDMAVETVTQLVSLPYSSAVLDPAATAYPQTDTVLLYWASEGDKNHPGGGRVVSAARTVTITSHPEGFRMVQCKVDWDPSPKVDAATGQPVYRNHNVIESFIFP